MSKTRDFTVKKAKPLPVILLLDVSGSMAGEKISTLNRAVHEMIKVFANEEEGIAEIQVSIITFGGTAELHLPLTPAAKVKWEDMTARGMTPLGGALDIAKEMIEDKEQIPSKSYRPLVVLVSDGLPNDSGWEDKLTSFIEEGRTKKVDRLAMAIGADADINMLKKFLNDPEKKVFTAQDVSQIPAFFRYVTMTVSTRSNSINPNVVPKLDFNDANDLIEDF